MSKMSQLEEQSISKLLVTYSIPAILGLVINAAYTMIDRVFIGNLPNHHGSLALSGIGVSMPITTFIIAISACIATGSLASISTELGKGDSKKAQQLLGNALSISIVTGVILTFLFYLFKMPIFQLLGANKEILVYTDRFLSILMVGTIFSILGFVIPILIRANGSPVISAIIMISGAIVNIILDWFFIFKLNMGIEGPAIATVIAQIVVTILGITYLFRPQSILRPQKEDYRIHKANLSAIFSVGMVPMFNQLSVSVAQIIANWSLQNNGGTLYIGAMASISSVVMIATMVLSGIAQGSMPIISFNIGRNNLKRVREAIKLSLIICFLFLVGCTLLIFVFSDNIVALFSNDSQLIQIASHGLKLYGALLPLMAVTTLLPGYLSLVGYPKVAVSINIFKQLIMYGLAISIFPLFLGKDGIWLAQPATEFVTLLISIYFAKRYLFQVIQETTQEEGF